MASRRGQKKARDYSPLLLILTGSVLTLCALSVMYGFLIRKSMADNNIRGFRIEVLNGIGEQGVARRAAVLLMKKGIDVFQVGNADSFSYTESILIGCREIGNLGSLGRALGCDNVVEELKEDSLVDATLILGADYQTLNLGGGTDSRLLK